MIKNEFLSVYDGVTFDPKIYLPLIGGGVVIVLILFFILYFTIFSRVRLKKAATEIISRFENEHALLFGDILAYIRRLETISTMNLIYVEDYMNWDSRYKSIRDSIDATAQATSNSVKDLLAEGRFKELKEYIPTAKKTIGNYEEQVESLYSSLKTKFHVEDNVTSLSVTCKEAFRAMKQDYYAKQNDISILRDTFEFLFKKIDGFLVQAENDIENARYDEAETIYRSTIMPVVETARKLIKTLPAICLQITNVLPDKIATLSNRYDELLEAGYPLSHIMTKGTITSMHNELKQITTQISSLDTTGVELRFESIRNKIRISEEAFEKEIEARKEFEKEHASVSNNDVAIQNSYLTLIHALPQIEKIFLLSDESKADLAHIKELINKSAASKRNLDTCIHGGTKQPYSVLLEMMNTLKKETEEVTSSIAGFSAYLQSLKNDSEKAEGGVRTYFEAIRDAEIEIKSANIPGLIEKHKDDFAKAYGTIDVLYKIIRTKPIDVRKANEVYAELASVSDSVLAMVKTEREGYKKAEEAIVFANRYRTIDSTKDAALSQAENLFFNASFLEAYESATKVVESSREIPTRHR